MASDLPFDINTGECINKAKLSEEYGTEDVKFDAATKDNIKAREKLLKECYCAEAVCLATIGIAMVSLVWLALCTF